MAPLFAGKTRARLLRQAVGGHQRSMAISRRQSAWPLRVKIAADGLAMLFSAAVA